MDIFFLQIHFSSADKRPKSEEMKAYWSTSLKKTRRFHNSDDRISIMLSLLWEIKYPPHLENLSHLVKGNGKSGTMGVKW